MDVEIRRRLFDLLEGITRRRITEFSLFCLKRVVVVT